MILSFPLLPPIPPIPLPLFRFMLTRAFFVFWRVSLAAVYCWQCICIACIYKAPNLISKHPYLHTYKHRGGEGERKGIEREEGRERQTQRELINLLNYLFMNLLCVRVFCLRVCLVRSLEHPVEAGNWNQVFWKNSPCSYSLSVPTASPKNSQKQVYITHVEDIPAERLRRYGHAPL